MLNFCDERDFRRRCTAWVILTVVEFASPSFWLFALLMFIVLRWCARKDGNPLATYALLLNAVPPLQADVPFVGINVLFSLDTYRLLALGILIPFVWQQRKASHQASFGYMDFMLLIFGALQIALFVRPDTPDAWQLHDSFTNILRRACLFFIDAYMLYAAFKHLGGRAKIREFMAFYCLGCAILAALAIFESLRHWLLYADVGATWGVEAVTKYLDRAGYSQGECLYRTCVGTRIPVSHSVSVLGLSKRSRAFKAAPLWWDCLVCTGSTCRVFPRALARSGHSVSRVLHCSAEKSCGIC